jgi:hypothetical protein
LIRCAQRTEFEFRLENDVALIEPLVELLQEIAVSMQVVSGSRSAKMGVALEHALHNAMFRGNLEIPRGSSGAPDMALLRERLADPRYRERRVLVWAKVTPTEAQIVITDEGPGFDAAKFLSSATPEALAEAGRGLVLMKSFFGNLQFNERGNQVTLIQRVSTH